MNETILQSFPQFQEYRKRFNKNLHYLDSASTTFVPENVIKVLDTYYRKYGFSNDRSLFKLAEETNRLYEESRSAVARFLSVSSEEIIFTSGATDASNKILASLVESFKDVAILASLSEHHSTVVPLLNYRKKGVQIFLHEGRINDSLIKKIEEIRPKIVYIQHASNITGEVYPVALISKVVHSYEGIVVCDASQSIGKENCEPLSLGADVLFFSGHKICGPKGIGVLYVNKRLLEKLQPQVVGGGMVESVTGTNFITKKGNASFEAGTQNVAGVLGLSAALDFVKSIGILEIKKHIETLSKYATSKLKEIPRVHVVSSENSLGIVSFYVDGVHAHDIAQIFSDNDIAVRSGFMCAEPLVRSISNNPLVRVSFYVYSKKEDIDSMLTTLKKILTIFNK